MDLNMKISQENTDRFIALMLRFHQLGEALLPFDNFSISPAQVVYLDFIAGHGPCSLMQITEGLGLRPASVSTMVKVLEKQGLITRQANPDDRRSIYLQLSSKGQEVYAALDQYRRAKAERLLVRLSIAEQAQFLGLFEKTINE